MSDLRALASWLLLGTGLVHVAEFFWLGMSEAAAGLGIFGVAYLAVGAWLRGIGKPALIAGIVVPTLGGLGGVQALATSFDPLMLAYVVVDLAVVVLCIQLLRRPAAAEGTVE
jgi:hypothetical protein